MIEGNGEGCSGVSPGRWMLAMVGIGLAMSAARAMGAIDWPWALVTLPLVLPMALLAMWPMSFILAAVVSMLLDPKGNHRSR